MRASARVTLLRDQPRLGVLLFVGNLFLMALLSALVKSLADRYPLTELLFFRFIFAGVMFLFLLPGMGGFKSLKTSRPLDHAVRSIAGVVSLGLFFYALSTIALADATVLAYSAPIFIAVLSIPLLGERVGIRRWSAILIGFIGVILIARPIGNTWDFGALAGVGSAIAGAFVAIWLRRLSSTEKHTTIGMIYSITGMSIYAFWTSLTGWVLPTGFDLFFLAAIGLIAGLQQVLFTLSYRYAEASFLAPFEYVIFIFAAVIGFVFWNEIPSFTTWTGATIIICSGIFMIIRRRSLETHAPTKE